MATEDLSLLLFRYGEQVTELKRQAMSLWREVPVENMEFFGGEVLASGVVLWSLLTATGLDVLRWPGDLVVVLGLKVSGDKETKVGHIVEMVTTGLGLVGAEVDQLQMTFLEMLQWLVVDQLHASLFTNQRQELAGILSQGNFAKADRAEVLAQMSDFLNRSQIDAFAAKGFFEKSLHQSLAKTVEIFRANLGEEKAGEILSQLVEEK